MSNTHSKMATAAAATFSPDIKTLQPDTTACPPHAVSMGYLGSTAPGKSNLWSIYVSPDGRHFFIGNSGNVFRYDPSTPYLPPNATVVNTIAISNSRGICFSPDGTMLFVTDTSSLFYRYDLSTAWDLSTATLSQGGVYLTDSGGTTLTQTPQDIFISLDGRYLYGPSNDTIYQYTMSTPFDITTLSYTREREDVGLVYKGVSFTADGMYMGLMNAGDDTYRLNKLTTAWDISTSTQIDTYGVGTYETNPTGLHMSGDGYYIYVVGTTGDYIDVWRDLQAAGSVSAHESNPYGTYVSPTGNFMYAIGTGGDSIFQYNLDPPFVLESKGYGGAMTVSSYDLAPVDIYFHPDGHSAFVLGSAGLTVDIYRGFPWATGFSAFSFYSSKPISEMTTCSAFSFKPDGTRMYIMDNSTVLHEYALSTPWAPQSATYTNNKITFSTQGGGIGNDAHGFDFTSDGLNMFLVRDTNNSGRNIQQWKMTEPWSLSSLYYYGSSPSYSYAPKGLRLSRDNKRLYCLDYDRDRISAFKFGDFTVDYGTLQ